MPTEQEAQAAQVEETATAEDSLAEQVTEQETTETAETDATAETAEDAASTETEQKPVKQDAAPEQSVSRDEMSRVQWQLEQAKQQIAALTGQQSAQKPQQKRGFEARPHLGIKPEQYDQTADLVLAALEHRGINVEALAQVPQLLPELNKKISQVSIDREWDSLVERYGATNVEKVKPAIAKLYNDGFNGDFSTAYKVAAFDDVTAAKAAGAKDKAAVIQTKKANAAIADRQSANTRAVEGESPKLPKHVEAMSAEEKLAYRFKTASKR